MTAPALILLNPHAGGGRAAASRLQIERSLALRSGRDAVLAVTPSVDDALTRIATLPAPSRLVVVGGDGTVNRLLPALLGGGHELGLIPAGSGNDTARALGLHRMGFDRVLDLALEGPASPMDVGEAVYRPAPAAGAQRTAAFVSSLTAGFDSAVGRRAIEGPRWLRGLPRYLLATLRELAVLRNTALHVQVDGRPVHEGPLLFASTLNTPTYASGMPCVPHASTTDARLDLLLAGPFGRTGTLVMLPLLLAGWHLRHPRVRCIPCQSVTIESARPLPLAADGEYLGEVSGVSIRIHPGRLKVVRTSSG